MKLRFVLIIFLFSFMFFSCSNKEEAAKLYVQANEYYAKQDLESAKRHAELSLSKDKNFYQSAFLRAKIFYFQKKYDESEKELRKLVKHYPIFTESRIWLIRLLIANEKYTEAEKLLNEELLFNQTDWRLYYQYAVLSLKLGQTEKRLMYCRRAEQILSDTEKLYTEMADIWLEIGMRDRALDSLEKAEIISNRPETIKELIKYVKQGKDIQ